MQSQLILSITLLSAIALATPHEKKDTHSKEIKLDRFGDRWKATNVLFSKASDKKAEVEAVANSLSTLHPTKPSKPTSSPPSNSKTSTITVRPEITAIPTTAMGGALSNHTASGGSNNSTRSAPILISTTTTSTATSDSATQDTAETFSTLETSSIPNLGTVKLTGALAVGVAGMMILL